MAIQSPNIIASSPIEKSLKIWNYISDYSLICVIVLLDTKNFKILSFALYPSGYYLASLSNEDMNFYGNGISKENKKYNFEKNFPVVVTN